MGLGEYVPVHLGAVALATEGKTQTCAKRNATDGVSGNPFPDKTATAPECLIKQITQLTTFLPPVFLCLIQGLRRY